MLFEVSEIANTKSKAGHSRNDLLFDSNLSNLSLQNINIQIELLLLLVYLPSKGKILNI